MITGEESEEFKRGYRFGFEDNYLEYWILQRYSPEFQKGYREGKAEIDRLVDEAAQANYSYHHYEE